MALLAVVFVGGHALPAVAAPAPRADVLTVLGGGGWLVSYGTEVFGPPHPWSVRVAKSAVRDRVVIMGANDAVDWVDFEVAAPEGRPRLVPGRYTSDRLGSGTGAILDLGLESRGCGDHQGTFEVLGLTRGPDGALTGLALDYSTRCDDDPPVTGSLRWNSDVPYAHTAVTSFVAPDTGPRQTATGSVTLTNAGTVPQTYGATTWLPDLRSSIPQSEPRVTRDGCVGVTLAPGRTCTVAVSVRADGMRGAEGHLVSPDDSLRGVALSPVRMRAVPGPAPVTIVATPRRGGIELSTAGRNPAYRVLRSTAGAAATEVASGVPLPWTDRSVTAGTRYTYRVVPQSGGLAGEPSAPVTTGPLPVPVGAEGTFVAVEPVRVVDTRTGTGVPRGPVEPSRTIRFDPAAAGQVPRTGVSAVLLNVTGTGATTATHLRVWPAGQRRPATSSLNLVPHRMRANQVVVPVGEDGRVELSTSAGRTHVVVDVQGFYSAADGPLGGGYHPVGPVRVLDTRRELGRRPVWPLRPRWVRTGRSGVDRRELSGVDPATAAAVEVIITVTRPTRAGHVTAWSGVGPAPHVSHLNYAAGETIANHAVVPVSRNLDGEPVFAMTFSAGKTHVVVDVVGWYDADALDTRGGFRAPGLRFRPTPPVRLLDTRAPGGGGRVEPGSQVVVPGAALPPAGAHVVNVTATGSAAGGHLVAWSGEGTLPRASTVNFGRDDAASLTTATAGSDGRLAVTAATSGVHVVLDHLGFFY